MTGKEIDRALSIDRLKTATVGELRLLLQVIERQGKQWACQMPSEAAKEAAIHARFDPNLWETLRLKHKDYRVDIVGDLAHIKMLIERCIRTIDIQNKPIDLRLTNRRSSAQQWEDDHR